MRDSPIIEKVCVLYTVTLIYKMSINNVNRSYVRNNTSTASASYVDFCLLSCIKAVPDVIYSLHLGKGIKIILQLQVCTFVQ